MYFIEINPKIKFSVWSLVWIKYFVFVIQKLDNKFQNQFYRKMKLNCSCGDW